MSKDMFKGGMHDGFSAQYTNKVHPSNFGCLFIRVLACTGKCMSLLRKCMPVCASTNNMNKYVLYTNGYKYGCH